MAKEMVMFNAEKKINAIIIHYNEKLDGQFVRTLEEYIVRVAKKMRKVDLNNPTDNESVHVYIYPSLKYFNSIFGQAIEKRYYKGKRTLEDMYIVQDEDGNIHMASPRGKGVSKTDMLTKILVVKILGEFLEEKEKKNLNNVTREAFKDKLKEMEEKEGELEDKKDENEAAEEEPEEEIDEDQPPEDEEREIDIEEYIVTQEDIEKQIEDEKELPLWIIWGWSGVVKGKLKKTDDIRKFKEYMNKKGFVKAKKVSKPEDEEFAVIQVEYIIDTYSLKTFRKVVENPDDMYYILHTTKYKFEKEVKGYAYSKYSLEEMKLDIDSVGVNNITKVEITSDSSCDIISEEEIGKNKKIIE